LYLASPFCYNAWMVKPKATPKVTWIETHTGIAAQQALSDQAKRAKIARRVPAKKVVCLDD
jgi:hypothetical protein